MVKNIMIVSLSSGIIGEDFVSHEVEIGLQRLEGYGICVKFAPNARRGMAFLDAHPEARAADMIEAFSDPDVDMILCAIGGEDTYRLAPYLFENGELASAVEAGRSSGGRDKIFLGFSDTTLDHLMLHRVGVATFYGQAFLSDVCELDREMLPYTRRYFEELISTGRIAEITPSGVWYESRTDFGVDQVGTSPVSHDDRGFELLQGPPTFSGKILGGCVDSLFDIFDTDRNSDEPEVCAKYGLFPAPDGWRGRILLLESSEEKMKPEKFVKAIVALKDAGVFGAVSGVLVGKPMDETYQADYHRILTEVIGDPSLPIVANVNIGHATPRCVIPFGVEATVDAAAQKITFEY